MTQHLMILIGMTLFGVSCFYTGVYCEKKYAIMFLHTLNRHLLKNSGTSKDRKGNSFIIMIHGLILHSYYNEDIETYKATYLKGYEDLYDSHK